jgi:hypothetical protein
MLSEYWGVRSATGCGIPMHRALDLAVLSKHFQFKVANDNGL